MYHQLAIGALLAILFSGFYAIAVGLFSGGTLLQGTYVLAAFHVVGLVFVPLLWWGHKLGFVGGMIIGILELVSGGWGISLVGSGELPNEAYGIVGLSIVVGIVILVASYMALRESA
ncbi:MAG: hypothetical protein ACE5LS_06365 [Thermoplasmata archaeon]